MEEARQQQQERIRQLEKRVSELPEDAPRHVGPRDDEPRPRHILSLHALTGSVQHPYPSMPVYFPWCSMKPSRDPVTDFVTTFGTVVQHPILAEHMMERRKFPLIQPTTQVAKLVLDPAVIQLSYINNYSLEPEDEYYRDFLQDTRRECDSISRTGFNNDPTIRKHFFHFTHEGRDLVLDTFQMADHSYNHGMFELSHVDLWPQLEAVLLYLNQERNARKQFIEQKLERMRQERNGFDDPASNNIDLGDVSRDNNGDEEDDDSDEEEDNHMSHFVVGFVYSLEESDDAHAERAYTPHALDHLYDVPLNRDCHWAPVPSIFNATPNKFRDKKSVTISFGRGFPYQVLRLLVEDTPSNPTNN